MGDLSRAGALLLSVLLGGCGLLSNTVGTTSAAALAPVATIVQGADIGLATVDHTVSTMATSARATSIAAQQTARTVQATTATTAAARPAAPPSLTKAQKDAIAKGKDAPQPDIEALPDETLAKLTTDQRGLQKAAQRAALKADIGETLFWDNEGRSGSVLAQDEHALGQSRCRTFVHEVIIDGQKTEARAVACLDSDSGHWVKSF